MIKPLDKFTEEEKLKMLLCGIADAMYCANIDKDKYEIYKLDGQKELTAEEVKEMEILSLLERLGYSMDELGTYLYKDVIAEVYEFLKNVSNRRDMDKCRNLLAQLNDGFSQFYHNISRGDKEMGLKTFHLYIQKSIENIDDNKIDIELSKSIYGDNPEELSYGLQAFQIASYALGKYSYQNTEEYKKPMVKKLDNIPNDIKLKFEY